MDQFKKFHNLSNDYLFKKVFFDSYFLKMLLKDLFDISVKNFTYMNPEIPKGNQYKSKGSCDIVVENEKEIIIVEMQNQKIKNFAKRSMIYIYQEYIKKSGKNMIKTTKI